MFRKTTAVVANALAESVLPSVNELQLDPAREDCDQTSKMTPQATNKDGERIKQGQRDKHAKRLFQFGSAKLAMMRHLGEVRFPQIIAGSKAQRVEP